MNDQPMDDRPRRNLANIARKVLRHVYEYIKVDSKSGGAWITWVKMVQVVRTLKHILMYSNTCNSHAAEIDLRLSNIAKCTMLVCAMRTLCKARHVTLAVMPNLAALQTAR